MSNDRKYHGGNLYSVWSDQKQSRIHRYQKKWFDPELGKTKKYTEEVPDPYRRQTGARAATSKPLKGLDAARAFKKDVDTQNARGEWVPSTVQRERATATAQAARQQRDDREDLLFEKAWRRFLADLEAEGNGYANQREAHRSFERMERFWSGVYLDQITASDVKRFYTQRMNGTVAYSGCRKISIRTPEIEMTLLGALYRHLRDTYPALPNRPWPLRPTSSRKGTAFAAHKRQHEWQVPSNERLAPLLREIFAAESKAKNGHDRIKDSHRALWLVTFFTAARPESEPCRLRCGDVEFRDDGWAIVSYRDTKNEQSRRDLPVPPVVAKALRSLMPTRFGVGPEQWQQTPVFRKKGPGGNWTQSSYTKAWAAAREAVPGATEQPLKNRQTGETYTGPIWLRDLRPAARTVMRRAKIDREVFRAFLGHAPADVDEGYDRVSPEELREAAEALNHLVLGSMPQRASA